MALESEKILIFDQPTENNVSSFILVWDPITKELQYIDKSNVNEDLQSVIDVGSTAVTVSAIQLTSNDGTDVSTLLLSNDSAALTRNGIGVVIDNNGVEINSALKISDAVNDDEAVTKGQLDNITIEKTVTSNISTGVDWQGKTVILNNDATTRTITINNEINSSGLKTNAGTVIFAQGIGRTLILCDNISNLNGAIGSAFAIVSVGTTDYLYINNK